MVSYVSKKSKPKLQTTSEMLERYSSALSEVAATHQRGMTEWLSSMNRTRQASESMDKALEQQRMAIMRMMRIDSEENADNIIERLRLYCGLNGLTISDLIQQHAAAASEEPEGHTNKEAI
jgi:hypothetical protein